MAVLTGVNDDLFVVLICVSTMTDGVEHFGKPDDHLCVFF
jgi:hypothetical protein